MGEVDAAGFEIVRGHIQKSGNKNKQYYDKKIHGLEINIGDRVLLRNYREKGGTGKLCSHWEDTVYLVTGIDLNVPVYSIRPEMGSKPVKKVHRNNIMNCNFLLPKVINNPDRHNTENIHWKALRKSKQNYTNGRWSPDEKEDEDDLILIRRTKWMKSRMEATR